jgi:hypothetical protein
MKNRLKGLLMSDPGKLITLQTPLSFRRAFRFPLQSRESIREIWLGALWLVILPGVGWLLNMGHRLQVVHNLQSGQSPWPAWSHYGQLLKLGLLTWLGMVYYYLPGAAVLMIGLRIDSLFLEVAGGILLIVATLAIPGYMSHYCVRFDPAEIYNPFKALRRCFEGGRAYWKAWGIAYWKAWGIALSALTLSFLGLLAFGVGFFVTSVWFWQVAGYSFANVFTQKFQLGEHL